MKEKILVLGAGFGGLELSTLISESLGELAEVTLQKRRADLDEGARLLLAQETVTADQFPAIRSADPQTKSAA